MSTKTYKHLVILHPEDLSKMPLNRLKGMQQKLKNILFYTDWDGTRPEIPDPQERRELKLSLRYVKQAIATFGRQVAKGDAKRYKNRIKKRITDRLEEVSHRTSRSNLRRKLRNVRASKVTIKDGRYALTTG